MPQVRIDGTDLDANLENGEWLDKLVEVVEVIEEALDRMKSSPGDANEEITLVIVNDFEPEEEEKPSGT